MAFRPTTTPSVCLERSEPLGPFTPAHPKAGETEKAPRKTGQAATLLKNQKEIPARCFHFSLKYFLISFWFPFDSEVCYLEVCYFVSRKKRLRTDILYKDCLAFREEQD